MSRIGIIGTGSMGSMLARKFIEAGVIAPKYITAYNHTPEKLNELVYLTGIRAAKCNRDVVKESKIIFICVRPGEISDLFTEIRPFLKNDKIIISVVSDITIKKIHELSGLDAVRVIPSITSECRSGISVISFGETIPESVREEILILFSSISRPYVTAEENMSFLSDITSSSPGIIASIIQEYARAAVRKGKISDSDVEFLLTETFIGTAKLLSCKGFDLNSLISKVSTTGGITAEGVFVIEEKAPFMFDDVLIKMSEKHNLIGKEAKN
ncbi:MAG: NAD(P)-binding domain-containing protein [Methanomicrobium sp.]|nr:NAD(P)-binding domain-containing protein [Methanomicrobium sp.]